MAAGSTYRRRIAAGFAVLFVFVVLIGQTLAASRMVLPFPGGMNHSQTPIHLLPAGMAHDGPDAPCKHRDGSHDLICCLSAHCSLLSSWLATPAPALIPAALCACASGDTIAVMPDGLGSNPATPPPRHQV